MRTASDKGMRVLIRIAYLLPAVGGILCLIYAILPHLFFLYEGKAYETLGLFTLVNNTREQCHSFFEGTSGSPYVMFFAYIMTFFVIVFWIILILYAIVAVAAGVCSTLAFANNPISVQSNRAKRWLRFFCPNRLTYVLSLLLLPLPSLFPFILRHFYASRLGMEMQVCFDPVSDLVLSLSVSIISIALFFVTLNAQQRLRMDPFRLYKLQK